MASFYVRGMDLKDGFTLCLQYNKWMLCGNLWKTLNEELDWTHLFKTKLLMKQKQKQLSFMWTFYVVIRCLKYVWPDFDKNSMSFVTVTYYADKMFLLKEFGFPKVQDGGRGGGSEARLTLKVGGTVECDQLQRRRERRAESSQTQERSEAERTEMMKRSRKPTKTTKTGPERRSQPWQTTGG